ncbi:hypothetical protein [Geovibrio ferrireducens]|uniref:hypothetical protein n=1 Tax=Geovibrio ferrireducens TaxID=46201 RepID=UPI00224522F6|nr:hypothetical protein [Geovibrio ferrireducens]
MMNSRHLRKVFLRDWIKNKNSSYNIFGLKIGSISTVSELVGLALFISGCISVLWNLFFFKNIHAFPLATDGVSLWIFIIIALLGTLILSLILLLMLMPCYLFARIVFYKLANKYYEIGVQFGVAILPYLLIYLIIIPYGEYILNTIILVLYCLFLLSFFKKNKKSNLSLQFVLLYLFSTPFCFVMLIVIFRSSVIKTIGDTVFILIIMFIMLTLQFLCHLTIKRNKSKLKPLLSVMIAGLIMFFCFYLPKVVNGYSFHKQILISPYSIGNIGYYKSDIVVNKETYEMYMKLTGKKDYSNNRFEGEIKNAFILFSMGDEYIIKACVDKIPESEKNELWLGKKAKYRYYIIKASRNKEILPSSYTYEEYDWVSLHSDKELCATVEPISKNILELITQ